MASQLLCWTGTFQGQRVPGLQGNILQYAAGITVPGELYCIWSHVMPLAGVWADFHQGVCSSGGFKAALAGLSLHLRSGCMQLQPSR